MIKISIRYVLFALIFFLILRVQAQEFTIYAKILDSKTKQPVPFATIKVMNGKLIEGGVVSNGDGDFQIPFKYKSASNVLVITCIGYANRTMKTSELQLGKVNLIELKVTSTQLKELVITPQRQVKLSASKIVRLAIENIPKNNPTHPFSYVAYYRDYQREENEYVNLNEGVVGVYDNGFDSDDFLSTNLKLYELRPNNHFKRDSLTAIAYDNNSFGGRKFIPTAKVTSFGGNELSLLRVHDAIRNSKATSYSFVDEFRYGFIKNHSFKLLETVYLGDVPLYHIAFQTFYFVTRGQHTGRGDIFIEHGTYAIHKLIYSNYLNENGKETLLFSVQEEYAKTDSLMFLNYISFNNFFKANTNEGFKVNDVVYDRVKEAFVVSFNHPFQKATALDKGNYNFKFDKQPFKILKIELSENSDKEVYVYVRNANDFNLYQKPYLLAKKFEANFKNIKDTKGNVVNEIKYRLVNQFRELFLQKLNGSPWASEGPFIAKEVPLQKNEVDSLHLASAKYWMNTPLRNSADWEEGGAKFAAEDQPSVPPAKATEILPGQSDITTMTEKTYVQTDKPYYYPGEKMWFTCYMNYLTPNLKDSLSRVLYVELLNSEGKPEQTRILRIENGTASGNFNLSASIKPGDYFLRAYTNWMLNYENRDMFVKPLYVFNMFERPQGLSNDTTRSHSYGGIAVSTSKPQYSPREEINLTIQLKTENETPLGGNVSVSVTDIDQVMATPNERNIVEDYPMEDAKQSIMPDSLIRPIESGISFRGAYKNKKAKALQTKLMVIQTRKKKIEDFTSVDTDQKGKFWITGFQIYDSVELGLRVADSKVKMGEFVLQPREVPPAPHLKPDIVFSSKAQGNSQRPELEGSTGEAIMLKEVEVKAKKYRELPVDPYYGTPDYSVPAEKVAEYGSIAIALQSSIPGVRIFYLPNGGFAVRFGFSSFQSSAPLVIIDGNRVSGGDATFGKDAAGKDVVLAGVDALSNLDPYTIERIDVFKYGDAAIYGSSGASGVIIVHTKKATYAGGPKDPQLVNQDAFQIFKVTGYSKVDLFKSPDYSVADSSKKPDLRSTILWQPQVVIDEEDGKAELHFHAADILTRYRIVVEGVTSNLTPVRSVIFVEVRK